MAEMLFRNWDSSTKIDLCVLTGSFLKTLFEQKGTKKEAFAKDGAVFAAHFCERLLTGANRSCRKAAFLKPEFLFLSEPLLRLGFSVLCTPDEEFAQGLAAVQDFFVHQSKSMLLAAGNLDPQPLIQALAPCRITWLAAGNLKANQGLEADWLIFESSNSKNGDEIQNVPKIPVEPPENGLAIPENWGVPAHETFRCREVTEILRKHLTEAQKRLKAIRHGNFNQSGSTLRVIDFQSFPKDCETVERLFQTAFQCFRWIHEFDAKLTPEHEALLRDYAALGASSLCILRTMSHEKGQDGDPDELFSHAADVLGRIREKISDEIPHIRLESNISETLIPKNFKLLRQLNQRKSEVRLKEELRNLMADFSTQKAVSSEEEGAFWLKIAQEVTLLGKDFGESPNSDFLMSLFLPFLDEMPEFISETADSGQTEMKSPLFVPASSFFLRVMEALEASDAQNEADFEEAMTQGGQSPQTAAIPWNEKLARLSPSDQHRVQRVRDAFGGSQMVLIGGSPNPCTKSRLESFFGVRLIWEECGHHFGLNRYQPWIRNPEVTCFLVRKSCCSHYQYLELVREFQSYGKKCVRLRNETHPIAIAAKIVKQCLTEN